MLVIMYRNSMNIALIKLKRRLRLREREDTTNRDKDFHSDIPRLFGNVSRELVDFSWILYC